MIIYKVTNKINNKIYIGQTINSLEHRRKQHEKDCSLKCANNDPKHYLIGVKAASTKIQEQYQNSISLKIKQIED